MALTPPRDGAGRMIRGFDASCEMAGKEPDFTIEPAKIREG